MKNHTDRKIKRKKCVKWSISSNCSNDCTSQVNLQVQWNPSQHANVIFLRTGLNNFQIYMEPKKAPNAPSNSEKKKKAEGIASHGLKLCYKVQIIKTVKYLHKNRHVKQWNRIESSCLYPLINWWALEMLPNIGYCK